MSRSLAENKQRTLDAYDGICCYYAFYIDYVSEATTDHFEPQSKNATRVYDWDNYRLASRKANCIKKCSSIDILDPIGLVPDSFLLNLLDGSTYPNPTFSVYNQAKISVTIKRLKLNSNELKRTRATHYEHYLRFDRNEQLLRELNPFVWYEAQRQGML